MCLTAVSKQNLLMMRIRVYVHIHTCNLVTHCLLLVRNSSERQVFLSGKELWKLILVGIALSFYLRRQQGALSRHCCQRGSQRCVSKWLSLAAGRFLAAGEGSSRVTAVGDQAPEPSSLPHAGRQTFHLSYSSPPQALAHTPE